MEIPQTSHIIHSPTKKIQLPMYVNHLTGLYLTKITIQMFISLKKPKRNQFHLLNVYTDHL